MQDIAVLYARKSDPSAREDDPSFEQQEQACRKYAATQGYAVLEAIREAYTGTDLVKQAGLWQAIDAVKHGRAHVIIANSYDRLSRDTQAQEVALWEIEKKFGGRFEAATEQIDRNDPLRQMIRASLGAASAIERRRVVERLARGKRDRAEREGALSAVSWPKYGYRFTDEGRTAYTLEHETAGTVRRIYDWADQGHSMRWIARRLNAEGIPTPGQWASEHGYPKYDKRTGAPLAAGDAWRHEQVARILADSAYCGRMQVFKVEVTHPYRKNAKTGIMEKRTVVREREQGAVTLPETTCPAIVTVAQWERVQQGVAGRVKEGRPPLNAQEALFRGHVYCACGRKMTLSRNVKGTYNYLCPGRPSNVTAKSHACPYGSQSIRAFLVNAEGEAALQDILAQRDDVARLLKERIAGAVDETLERVTASLQALVARKRAERDKYLAGIGVASDASIIAALVEKAEKLAAELREDEAKLAEAQTRLDSLAAQRDQFAYVLAHLDTFRVQYTAALAQANSAAALGSLSTLSSPIAPPAPAGTGAIVVPLPAAFGGHSGATAATSATGDTLPARPPSLDDWRFLMDLVGLRLTVYPVGTLPEGKRMAVDYAVRGERPISGSSLTSSVTLPRPAAQVDSLVPQRRDTPRRARRCRGRTPGGRSGSALGTSSQLRFTAS